MRVPPRDAAAIAADLRALVRENDRLEHRVALATQNLKAAEAHTTEAVPDPERIDQHLTRAERLVRQAG